MIYFVRSLGTGSLKHKVRPLGKTVSSMICFVWSLGTGSLKHKVRPLGKDSLKHDLLCLVPRYRQSQTQS